MKNRMSGLAEFSFCAVFAATLSACGGGSAGSAVAAAAVVDSLSDTQVSMASAGASSDGAASTGDTSALSVMAAGESTTSPLANEGGTFTVTGTQVVQYGAGDNWVSKSVAGNGSCSNGFFGLDPRPNVAKSCRPVGTALTTLAVEGAAFSVTGTQTVQYGAGTTWVSKTVTGSGTCSNDFFGNDPARGTVKSCQVNSASVAALATEGGTFKVSGSQVVQFGVDDKWVTKRVTATGTCSNGFFGGDPAPGTVKACQLATTPSAAVALAAEGKTFSVSGTQIVQYGAGTKWMSKTVTGSGACSNTFFGGDPSSGVVKSCQIAAGTAAFQGIVAVATAATGAPTITVASPTPIVVAPVAASGSLLPTIDLTKVPAAAAGYTTTRVAAANIADPSQVPAPSDGGAFREPCSYSHMSYDDPIVYPGSVGGHLHTFIGNTGTNSKSNAQSIAGSGNSTCAGGTANRTGYWFPTVIDTRDGTPLAPDDAIVYYKQGFHYVTSASIKPFPAGLRMIAGNSASSAAQDFRESFTCYKPDGSATVNLNIPSDCPAGSTLHVSVVFPQCWDGINLDSPDHKSHMAYAVNACPASHPVPLTEITLIAGYKVTSATEGTSRWRLSSDNYDKSLPGGYSSHADWFNGWNADVETAWTTSCINGSLDCHAFLLGDGRTLY